MAQADLDILIIKASKCIKILKSELQKYYTKTYKNISSNCAAPIQAHLYIHIVLNILLDGIWDDAPADI